MQSGEKRAPESSSVVQAAPFRVPASVKEAYELGWQWHIESFANLRTFGDTIEGVTRREGLAHFKGPEGGIVIPFVATYAFGEPRVPKNPYRSGSVYSVDEEPEEPRPATHSLVQTIPDKEKFRMAQQQEEADKEKFRRIQYRFRGRVVHTYITPTPMTEEYAFYAFCDELDLYMSEVKTKSPSARGRTKKAKTRR